MIPDVLQGLYARRDALQQRLGEAIVTMSRVASASADARDDETASLIEIVTFKLQGVKSQIMACENTLVSAVKPHVAERRRAPIDEMSA